MAEKMKTCRVCGKEYEACRQRNTGVFRYRDVACSPECGRKYLKKIAASRDAEKAEAAPRYDAPSE